jgi:integrase
MGSLQVISEAPAPPIVPPPTKRKRKSCDLPFLSADDVDRLFHVIRSARDRAIFRVAYHAGLRASEIGMIEMRDYDAKAERLHIKRLKGSHSGIHHLCPEESRAFHAWLKVRGNVPGPVFRSNRKEPISRQMLDVLMKKYGEYAGIPKALRHFHILKHTCVTHLLAKGFHVDQVQDWVGHANIQNTMKYGHTTNSRRAEMAEQLREWR